MPTLTSIPGLSHLLGAGLFLVLSVFLIRRGRGDRLRVASLAVFAVGSVFLLSISGVYHLLDPKGTPRYVLQVLDHDAIFILIAASFTPVHVILFHRVGRWGVLTLVWLYAYTAIALKTIYFQSLPTAVGLSLYLGMGWIGAYTGISIWRRFSFRFMEPILWGGIAYSIGAVLEFMKWPVLWPGVVQSHEVFHVAVLIGLSFHWSFIYTIADGRLTPGVGCPVDVDEPCPVPTSDG
jgi:channel protein (hemolysin III family)